MSKYLFKTRLYALCLAASLAACSKKDKDDSASPAPVVDAEITGAAKGVNGTTISYRANVPGTKFKCMVEVEGQAGEWSDCGSDSSTTVQVQPGVRMIFKVKAIGPDGSEDIASRDISELTTNASSITILNKDEVASVYARKNLRLNFGLAGDTSTDVSQLRWECKRETDSAFQTCPTRDSYDFGELQDGGSYSLTVRALDMRGQQLGEDSVAFRVELPRVAIDGEEQLLLSKMGNVRLTFNEAARAGQRVQCAINEAPVEDCTQGLDLPLGEMPAGSYELRVEALDQIGNIVATSMLQFCARLCTPDEQPVVATFQIGSFYSYTLPADMHMTEYATTKDYNGTLSFYRIMSGTGPNQDPFYLGNYGCRFDFDRLISAPAPSGQVFDYCHSTPTRETYKVMNEFRRANNHLELATNPDRVDPVNHERILLNVFDRDHEYQYGVSRFEELCMNKRGSITRTPPIRFINAGFWGEWVSSEFYMCVAELAGPGAGGLPGATDEWWVGSFFIAADTLNLPKWDCFRSFGSGIPGPQARYGAPNAGCGRLDNPNLLEVVIMTKKPWREAADFARYAQSLMTENLEQTVPLIVVN